MQPLQGEYGFLTVFDNITEADARTRVRHMVDLFQVREFQFYDASEGYSHPPSPDLNFWSNKAFGRPVRRSILRAYVDEIRRAGARSWVYLQAAATDPGDQLMQQGFQFAGQHVVDGRPLLDAVAPNAEWAEKITPQWAEWAADIGFSGIHWDTLGTFSDVMRAQTDLPGFLRTAQGVLLSAGLEQTANFVDGFGWDPSLVDSASSTGRVISFPYWETWTLPSQEDFFYQNVAPSGGGVFVCYPGKTVDHIGEWQNQAFVGIWPVDLMIQRWRKARGSGNAYLAVGDGLQHIETQYFPANTPLTFDEIGKIREQVFGLETTPEDLEVILLGPHGHKQTARPRPQPTTQTTRAPVTTTAPTTASPTTQAVEKAGPDVGFCCYTAPNPSDVCGTCYPLAIAKVGSGCEFDPPCSTECGGLWCYGQAPTVAPVPGAPAPVEEVVASAALPWATTTVAPPATTGAPASTSGAPPAPPATTGAPPPPTSSAPPPATSSAPAPPATTAGLPPPPGPAVAARAGAPAKPSRQASQAAVVAGVPPEDGEARKRRREEDGAQGRHAEAAQPAASAHGEPKAAVRWHTDDEVPAAHAIRQVEIKAEEPKRASHQEVAVAAEETPAPQTEVPTEAPREGPQWFHWSWSSLGLPAVGAKHEVPPADARPRVLDGPRRVSFAQGFAAILVAGGAAVVCVVGSALLASGRRSGTQAFCRTLCGGNRVVEAASRPRPPQRRSASVPRSADELRRGQLRRPLCDCERTDDCEDPQRPLIFQMVEIAE